MIKKIYISGPISGRPALEVETEFNLAQQQLQQRYPEATIVNPLTLCPVGMEWKEAMRKDLGAMLDECDTIAMLPGWEKSRGAKLEFIVATSIGMAYIIDGEAYTAGECNMEHVNIVFEDKKSKRHGGHPWPECQQYCKHHVEGKESMFCHDCCGSDDWFEEKGGEE